MSKEDKIKLIRIAIFGDSGAGKTSIFRSFCGYEFIEDIACTIGWEKIYYKNINGKW